MPPARLLSRLRGDQGAASAEYTALLVALSLVVGPFVLLVGGLAPGLAQRVEVALCQIFTDGSCGASAGTGPQREPDEPCVTGSSGDNLALGLQVSFVQVGSDDIWQVEALSDGTFRATRSKGGSAGGNLSVGGGLAVTVNDATVGGLLEAGVSADLVMEGGETWVVDSPEDLQRLVDEKNENRAEDLVFGLVDGGGLDSARWAWERGQDLVGWVTGNGDYEFPPPDEVFIEGGAHVDASAQAVLGLGQGSAAVGGGEVLGTRISTSDGSYTVYRRVELEGSAFAQGLGGDGILPTVDGSRLEGRLEYVQAVSFTADGEMTEVGITALAAGSAAGVTDLLFDGRLGEGFGDQTVDGRVIEATLPIDSAADRDLALRYLAATNAAARVPTGPTAVAAALSTLELTAAVRDRGDMVQQTVSVDEDTLLAMQGGGKVGPLALGGSFAAGDTESVFGGQQYFDGASWQDRGCGS